ILATQLVSNTTYFKLAESLGGVKSLICLPCEMTHKSIPLEKRHQSGVTDSLIRLSVGLEDAEDLINDLKTVFQTIAKKISIKA
ncbi:MAG TPA: PLP-dependent transferase, partial [Chitinophagaceae bacterium]|nr:PLP-dependent transferase [Chitinophagaceae bacterium]